MGMGKEDKRRYFTREFKVNAVQLVTEKGLPVGKVAQELDIHPIDSGYLMGRSEGARCKAPQARGAEAHLVGTSSDEGRGTT